MININNLSLPAGFGEQPLPQNQDILPSQGHQSFPQHQRQESVQNSGQFFIQNVPQFSTETDNQHQLQIPQGTHQFFLQTNPQYSNVINFQQRHQRQQFSDVTFNSFLAQFGQRPITNNLNQNLNIRDINQIDQRYHQNLMAPEILSLPQQQFQFSTSNSINSSNNLANETKNKSYEQKNNGLQKHIHQAPLKKLSTAQSRIEQRKKLKKQGPKRPSSAYFLYSMSIRKELLKEYPDAKVPELSKISSAKWKLLNEEQKQPFYNQFKKNWETYRIVRKEYELTLPPKRPSGPFIQFTSEIRPNLVKEFPEKTLIEITKLVGEKWRSLTLDEKRKYTDNYKKKLKEWEAYYPTEENDNVKSDTSLAKVEHWKASKNDDSTISHY